MQFSRAFLIHYVSRFEEVHDDPAPVKGAKRPREDEEIADVSIASGMSQFC
jgi:hypothetical protein